MLPLPQGTSRDLIQNTHADQLHVVAAGSWLLIKSKARSRAILSMRDLLHSFKSRLMQYLLVLVRSHLEYLPGVCRVAAVDHVKWTLQDQILTLQPHYSLSAISAASSVQRSSKKARCIAHTCAAPCPLHCASCSATVHLGWASCRSMA